MRYAIPLLATVCLNVVASARAAEPLPSWNDSASKRAIVAFVEKTTNEGSPDFVSPPNRIATFDNDGTLWCEQPIYVQAVFTLDRIKTLAPQNPEWKTKEPFASVLRGDMKAVLAGREKVLLELIMTTHADLTTEEFEQIVRDWMATARHPKTGRLYTEMVYQPMLELLAYLRDHGFKTFIVSGGGVEFMRPWTERVYGVPGEQVVGSSIRTKYEIRDGLPVLLRLPEVNFIDDKAGKPVGIQQHIGRRPLFAAGNSDGDFEMLEWTTAGSGPRLAIVVHHTDVGREYQYDRQSHVGQLDRALNVAERKRWIVVDMKRDWRHVFPFEFDGR